jgi:hypothetical protein
MGDIEQVRLRLMKTCCRELDVSNRSTFRKSPIFREIIKHDELSAELKIYGYICNNCEQTFGFYADGYIPEHFDIKDYENELNKAFGLGSHQLETPARLACDTLVGDTVILIVYNWKTNYGKRSQDMPIFEGGRPKEDIWRITMRSVDRDLSRTPPETFAKIKSDLGPVFKDAWKYL